MRATPSTEHQRPSTKGPRVGASERRSPDDRERCPSGPRRFRLHVRTRPANTHAVRMGAQLPTSRADWDGAVRRWWRPADYCQAVLDRCIDGLTEERTQAGAVPLERTLVALTTAVVCS